MGRWTKEKKGFVYRKKQTNKKHNLVKISLSIDIMKENGFKLEKKRSRRYPAQTITDADYTDDIVLLANAPAQAKTQLHSLEWEAVGIGLHINAHKMCFNQRGNISTLNVSSPKLVDKFTYLGSSVSSTETDINTWQVKAWTAIERLLVIWKSNLTDKIKCSFFQAAIMSILLYGCTTWMLTKCMEKKLDGNYTRMLRTILNKSWRQHPTKQQLYGHQPPITKTIKVRWTRHTGHSWRSKEDLISDVLQWTPSQDNQLEPTYSSSVPMWDVVLKTCRNQWTIEKGGEEGSGISMLMAWHEDDS